ncbi:hypothetical protein ACPSLY_15315 [Vibrio parahaemolyticus]|uniref:Uncharacterized protein n=1 Tax=Vibrio parahaemolyticus TaxID=670 RepID=A0AA47JMW8_VIBPH|nr:MULTISPECIES: hypothetical protein [Vibrio]AYO05885.1 hypothetical protein D0871_16975 [Vibrio parahaemolyticus]EJG0617912.1 hypothetical protein [Vibrio parahaemolyticus]EJG0636134.1 hypothetical protein [Vibrio parahaemolyticus]EJG0685476.1 hypothetical protein [Vibrio parahaemolyticus]EJG0698875.1 hypothetical protein [Vibrio parahaemolyticus]
MSKSQITRVELENALKRILSGKTERIAPNRKISVKAVEEEAGLGDGSAYYYKEVIDEIKKSASKRSPKNNLENMFEEKLSKLRERLANESRLKEKYRSQVEEYKTQLADMASQHNQLALIIQQYQYKVAELESTDTVQLSNTSKEYRDPD